MLTELFKTEERLKILYYIMYRDEFTVTEVSRETKVSKGLVSRYLAYLDEKRLIKRSGRMYLLEDSSETRAIKTILNLERIHLEKLDLEWASSSGLFGSWASGTNTHESDVDIWVMMDKYPSEHSLSILNRDLRKMTGSKVNLLILTQEKLDRIKSDDVPLYNSLLRNSIILKGEKLG